MFIQHLSNDQQAALFCFAKKIIAVDGHIDEKEEVMLEAIRAQCNDNVNFDLSIDLGSLIGLFEYKHQKVSFMLELIGVAYADEDYQESEKTIIAHLAEAFEIPSTLLEDMESWVRRQMILVKEANLFMEM